MLGVKQLMSTAYHPQTDGQTERSNRTLEDMLRHFVSPNQGDWDIRLPCCEFAVNNAWNAATGSTPFFLNHGDHPRSPVSADIVCRLPAARAFGERVNEAIARARNCLSAARARMKDSADVKRRDLEFQVNDKVLLSTKNLKLAVAGSPKFKAKYVGPFEISDKVGKVAYKLKLPEALSKLHPVFHVSLLKQWFEKDNQEDVVPTPILVDGETEYFIDKVISHHDVVKGNKKRREFLVQREGYEPEEITWFDGSEILEVIAYSDYRDGLNESPSVRSERFDSQPELMKPTRVSERLRKRCL